MTCTRAWKACAEPGCPEILRQGGRCARHARKPWANRGSARDRGYTGAWDRRSKELREAGLLCAYCGQELMVALDHRRPLSQGGGTDPDENGVPIGPRCHAKKTGREAAQARRARVHA